MIRISPLAYLRAIWSLIVGVFRYPCRTTVIDLTTGRAVHLKRGEKL